MWSTLQIGLRLRDAPKRAPTGFVGQRGWFQARRMSSFPSQGTAQPAAAAAAAPGSTHYSFGGAVSTYKTKTPDAEREQKTFNDLFEFNGTVAKDSTIEEGRFSVLRLWWAKPIDYKDDPELDQKKAHERRYSLAGFLSDMFRFGERVIARETDAKSWFVYLRDNMGSLVWLQMFVQLTVTMVLWLLLEAGAVRASSIHKWWVKCMPVSADFADEASLAKADATWPVRMTKETLDNMHCANTIGTWTMPLQMALVWKMHPSVMRLAQRSGLVDRFFRFHGQIMRDWKRWRSNWL